jgi:hypothetical protein
MRPSMSPANVRIINYIRKIQKGKNEWVSLLKLINVALEQNGLLSRLFKTDILPLVRAKGDNALKEGFRYALEEQENLLRGCRQAAEGHNLQVLGEISRALWDNDIKIVVLLDGLDFAKENTLRVSSIKILNEVILIGVQVSRGEADSELLRQRLPNLRNYINYVESTIEKVRGRFPDEKQLIDFFQETLRMLKEGAGGLFIYLEEGGVENLTTAVSLLDRAGMKLWAAFSALNQLSIEKQSFSTDPALDDAHQVLEGYKIGKLGQVEMEDALRRLKVRQEREAFETVILENMTFMKPSEKNHYIPKLIDTLDRQDITLAYMKENLNSFVNLEKALAEYKKLLGRQTELRKQLDIKLTQAPELLDAVHFMNLLEIIKKVYENGVPDAELEEKVIELDEYREEFSRRMFLQQRRHPETKNMASKMEYFLNMHKGGYDQVFAYIENGDKSLLPQAYEIIEIGSFGLMNLGKEAGETALRVEAGEENVICPFCMSANPGNSVHCVKCGNPIKMVDNPMGGGTLLDFREDEGVSTNLDRMGESSAESIKFMTGVIRDTIAGFITYEESEQLLLPYWDKIQLMEGHLVKLFTLIPKESEVTEMEYCLGDFDDALSGFKATLQQVFDGIAQRNPNILFGAYDALNKVSGELTRAKNKMENALSNYKPA